jgi:4-amino-4-deoxy-L-arabinose transferase-like glycosyltransferase
MSLAGRRIDPLLILILLAALGVRLYLATSRDYLHDEINTAIPLSKTISFDPANLHLPLRGENHPALPAYVVKISSLLFGTSRLGYRGMHLLLGLLTIVMVYGMTRQWYGPGAARWAAAFMAFNEYYLNVSSRATAHVPNLLFVTGAVYAFSRFLATERPRYLYLAGASVGLAFYCKESTALLLPVFALTLLLGSLYTRATGNPLKDETTEYWSVNPAIGVLLLGGVLLATFRTVRQDQLRIFLLVMFWAIFGFFTLIKRGDPPGRLDPVSWIWVEITIVPAIVLTGTWLTDVSGKWRLVLWTAAVLALATACAQLVLAE